MSGTGTAIKTASITGVWALSLQRTQALSGKTCGSAAAPKRDRTKTSPAQEAAYRNRLESLKSQPHIMKFNINKAAA
jgi:hypothetical protein